MSMDYNHLYMMRAGESVIQNAKSGRNLWKHAYNTIGSVLKHGIYFLEKELEKEKSRFSVKRCVDGDTKAII